MPCEDDRTILVDAFEEVVECLFDIAVGRVDRLLRFGLVGQKGADGCLAILGRPDLRRPVEGAGEAAQEQTRAILGLLIAQPRVPLDVAVEVGWDVARRMDEEDREGRGFLFFFGGDPARTRLARLFDQRVFVLAARQGVLGFGDRGLVARGTGFSSLKMTSYTHHSTLPSNPRRKI